MGVKKNPLPTKKKPPPPPQKKKKKKKKIKKVIPKTIQNSQWMESTSMSKDVLYWK